MKNMLQKDEFGLYINAPNYLDQRARMEDHVNKINAWKALPWYKKFWYTSFAWKKGFIKYNII